MMKRIVCIILGILTIGLFCCGAGNEPNDDIKLFQDVTDVQSKYFNPVYWMKASEITSGYIQNGKTSFRPVISCTRANYAIFLWRFAGKPNSNFANPYTDVTASSSTARYKAIMWATQQGYSVGYRNHTFCPNQSIKRREALIMLWRYEGSPIVSTSMFSDVRVNPSTDTYKAIAWAKYYSIVKGYGDGTFHPDEPMSRGDAALVLYKYALLKKQVSQTLVDDINDYRLHGDVAPDVSTGLCKFVSFGQGIEIDEANTLYEYPNTESSSLPEEESGYHFQNYSFGTTYDGSIPIALFAFNYGDEETGLDVLVAWNMQDNSEYAILTDLDFDHGNAVVFNPNTRLFSISTGTGDQKSIINCRVQNNSIYYDSINSLSTHMSCYNEQYVTSGVAYLDSFQKYIAQYVQPYSDDRMYAYYNSFMNSPCQTDTDSYRKHCYDYTGQSLYSFYIGTKQYIGFLYMTWSYYEEETGDVKRFPQGKADIYTMVDNQDSISMQYVGTQWFEPVHYEIESASVFNNELYIAYADYNGGETVYFYKADYTL